MLTRPRLSLFEAVSLKSRLKTSFIKQIFGFYPAALHVMEPVTAMGAKPALDVLYDEGFRASADWARPELELLGAFVSSRNGCVF